jgi:hypothetical protein
MTSITTGEEFNLASMIQEFLSDPKRSSLELPHMTTGQRKQTKKIVDEYPELKCESFGFGQDRKLHLFKQTANTSSGDETGMAQKADDEKLTECNSQNLGPVEVAGNTSSLHCIMEGAVCKLDLSGIHDYAKVPLPECSTASPSSCTSEGSPASTFREMLPPWLGPPPGLEVEVRNTFVHFNETPAVDERAVQSMPKNMFRQSLLKEAMNAEAGHMGLDQPPGLLGPVGAPNPQSRLQNEEDRVLAPGATVIIHGLQKSPAFNGLKGTVQSLDAETCRYNIFCSAGGRT